MHASTGGHVEPENDAQTQGGLLRWLYRFDCPGALSLGEYQLDLLGWRARARVAGHAAECGECRADVRAMRQYLAEPVFVQQSMVVRARRVATRLFTPEPSLAFGGLRGDGDAVMRVFETADTTITVAEGPGSGTLIGLVVTASGPPELLPDAEVRLVGIDGSAVRSTLDDLGHFEFADLSVGVYALEIELADNVVVLEDLRVA
jgi:hypothetical protein